MEKTTRYYLVGGHLEQDPNGNLLYWQEFNDLCEENLSLMEDGNRAIQRFVRGEDKACLVCGKRERCKETPEACTFEPSPMELMRENKRLLEEVEGERIKVKKLNDICIFSEQTTTMLLDQCRKLKAENVELKAGRVKFYARKGEPSQYDFEETQG